MSEKFKNIFRIPSARLQNWDYGSNAMYFITICAQNREHYFGEIENGVMMLSDMGTIAVHYWNEIPNHFPFVELGEYVVMPNHVHGIIIIEKRVETANLAVSIKTAKLLHETAKLAVSTNPISTMISENIKRTTNASKKWRPSTIGVIINQYKRICSINVRKIHPDFTWQTRFHDHIIRSQESFLQKSEYIKSNPAKWDEDEFFT